ncbi:hypothetical protein GGI20_005237 [Coemansia sp. BCRC 34301]|nr:hypothetical protein GGI20_005237 [Coemansia sp. BCRC 34301]
MDNAAKVTLQVSSSSPTLHQQQPHQHQQMQQEAGEDQTDNPLPEAAPQQLLLPADSDNQAIVPTTPATIATAAATVVVEDEEDDNSGEYSATSSLYGRSLSLIGTVGADINSTGEGPATSLVGLAPTLGGGTLSPPHTLVNSDGASMRVHTGSIRERNFNRRISAIHEDDSDVYSESRRSDSLIFGQPQTSVSPSRHNHHLTNDQNANVNSSNNSTRNSHHRLQRRRQRRMSEDDANGAVRLLSEYDCLSIVSGISEGGASTTRVRLATDRAYDALRIGAPPATYLGLGYLHYGGSNSQYPHRAMSFATSSDPGLPSTGSFYDYYLDPNDYVPNSGSIRDDDDDGGRDSDDSSACGQLRHGRRRRRDEDIVSLIRSDIAVYGSAVDDVKFPFLPDNFSEFSGSVVYSPSGAMGAADGERVSREQSEAFYSNRQPTPSPTPQQQQQSNVEQNGSRASGNKKSRRGKDRLIIRNGKTRDRPSNTGDPMPPLAVMSNAAGTSSQMRGSSAQPPLRGLRAAAAAPGPPNRPRSHYRRQSASEAYPSTTTVTVVAVANTSAGATGIRQTNNNSSAIRPNALMRFFKRITPKT